MTPTETPTGGAQTHAERCMALRSFPSLIPQILQRCGRNQELPWLLSALEDGHLDFAQAFNQGAPEPVFKKIDAALSFLDLTWKTQAPDVVGSTNKVLAFEVHEPAAFASYFDAFVARMLDQSERLDPTIPHRGVPWDRMHMIMGKVLLGAIAVDSVSSVQKLLEAHRGLAHLLQAPATMGTQLRDCVANADQCLFKPYFFALQMGREACMHALQKATGNLNAFGVRRIPAVHPGARADEQSIGVLDLEVFALACPQSTYALALTHWRATASDRQTPSQVDRALHTAAHQLLALSPKKGKDTSNQSFVPCFEAMGAYEIDPSRSFLVACLHGCADVAERIQGKIDWPNLLIHPDLNSQKFAIAVLRNALADRGDESAQRMGLLLMKKAIQDGVVADVFAASREYNEDWELTPMGAWRAQPVTFLVENNHLELLSMWMTQGMDPRAAPLPDVIPPLQLAQRLQQYAVEHTMKTFINRQKALAVLDDLDAPAMPFLTSH